MSLPRFTGSQEKNTALATSLIYSSISRHLPTHHILSPGEVTDVVAAGDVLGKADLGDDRG